MLTVVLPFALGVLTFLMTQGEVGSLPATLRADFDDRAIGADRDSSQKQPARMIASRLSWKLSFQAYSIAQKQDRQALPQQLTGPGT